MAEKIEKWTREKVGGNSDFRISIDYVNVFTFKLLGKRILILSNPK